MLQHSEPQPTPLLTSSVSGPPGSDTDGHLALGRAAEARADWRGALNHFEQAFRLDSARSCIPLCVGNALARLDRWQEAITSYRHALELNPHFPDALNSLGIALVRTGQPAAAIAAYTGAIELDPNHANAFFNLGKLSAQLNEFPTAASLFAQTLAINPHHAYAHHELGSVQERCGLLDDAILSYRNAVRLDPTRTVRENLANLLALRGDLGGITALEDLLQEDPTNEETHWNLGLALLLHGRYRSGWQQFEHRLQIPRFRSFHQRFPQPRWEGQPLAGRTLLLYGEQGHGDTLQFLRFVPLAAERSRARILLEVSASLHSLLEHTPGVDQCLVAAAPDAPRPLFDAHVSLMSLPHLIGLDHIPLPVPLHIPASTTVPEHTLNVGLAWAGNPGHKRDRLRSIPLAHWAPLASVEGVRFTSLQVAPSTIDAATHTFHFVHDCTGVAHFAELAAVIARLDLVLTVDTAVAHLAGTLGKPVWILLPNAVDWRWGLHSHTTPWYPSARLFRQTVPGSWTEVMAAIRHDLHTLAAGADTGSTGQDLHRPPLSPK